jgi:hypothetical protein
MLRSGLEMVHMGIFKEYVCVRIVGSSTANDEFVSVEG